MKKLLLALSAAVLFSGAAQAERYVMVTPVSYTHLTLPTKA